MPAPGDTLGRARWPRRHSGGRCENRGGHAGAECEIREALATPPCEGERIDPELQRFITSKLGAARRLVLKAQGEGNRKRANRLIKSTDRIPSAIGTRAAKAVRRGKLSVTCQATIDQRVRDLRLGVSGLRI